MKAPNGRPMDCGLIPNLGGKGFSDHYFDFPLHACYDLLIIPVFPAVGLIAFFIRLGVIS
jgi:hypothetical protein